MGDIKSAREIAMEKIDKIGEPTEEERMEWKYLPEGEKIAARFLKNDVDLDKELGKFDNKALPYVKRGINNVLVKNIAMPRDEAAKRIIKKAMEGIKLTKSDKKNAEVVFHQIEQVFTHYEEMGEQQRQQAYQQLKQQFTMKVQQAIRSQGGNPNGMNIDIESQPQFQEEWRKVKIQLDGQYATVLDQYREQLNSIR